VPKALEWSEFSATKVAKWNCDSFEEVWLTKRSAADGNGTATAIALLDIPYGAQSCDS